MIFFKLKEQLDFFSFQFNIIGFSKPNKDLSMNKQTNGLLALILFLVSISGIQAQDTIQVSLRANVQKDAIQLRWAVHSPGQWYFTNKHGIHIERYTLMRDGVVLSTPEKVVLTSSALKPHPLDDWQALAQTDNYAAIIAQALYGSDFELSGGEKGISQIIALSQEQEQRYAMAMYAADLSFAAAVFAGWGYEDKTAQAGERYLYRAIPVNPDNKKQIETGSAYVGLSDYEALPRPLAPDAIWGDHSVLLAWNYGLLEKYYNSYYLERSRDGIRFDRLSTTPLTNLMNNDRMFFNDTISNDTPYYYRLIGLSAFGQEGPASDTIQGQGISRLIYVPHITQAMPNDKGGVEVSWFFDEKGNDRLLSFELRRGESDKGPFLPVVSDISPGLRTITFDKPLPENYLVIAAIPKNGAGTVSFAHLLQMEDSIPPAIPTGLEGYVDTTGIVHLKWTANTESDFYGYRIYRGQTKTEELIPLNDIAIGSNEFKDSINIYNLNSNIYYSVTSLDKRYNQSNPSEVIELSKPDVIKPSPPFISKYQATDRGVHLEWIPGREESIRAFRIFRGERGTTYKNLVTVITNSNITSYLDSTVVAGTNYMYEVVAVNNTFLASDPSPEVTVKAKEKETTGDIKRFTALRTEEGIILKWEHTLSGVKQISIYRKEGESALSLWQHVEVWQKEQLDSSAKRNTVYEYLLVMKDRWGKPVSKQVKTD